MVRALLSLMAGLLIASLLAPASLGAESESTTIRLVAVRTHFKTVVDRAPKSRFSIGDVFWVKWTLRNEVAQFSLPKGAVVGTDVATFTVVSNTRGDVRLTTRLPGGTLRVAGDVGQGRLERIRVVGGTGAFAGARGVYETRPPTPGGNNRARNVYRLRLP